MTSSTRPHGIPAHELWPREAAKARGCLYPTTLLYTAYGAVVLNRPVESLDDREWTTLWISGPARRALAEHYRLAGTFTIGETWVFLEPTRYLYVPKETP